ncbi:RDD family protein [Sulfurospirillum arcachonense]|uniref:RDD family protein n=1 Tax=Sulfurospirillum arcachonense TaxID=57666 RepID=UPI00046ADDDF|nr:RDD family protein [Sulfurospirillum arcachonense]
MTEEEIIEKFERENITLAPISKRFFAHVIDMFLINILINILYSGSLENFTGNEEQIDALMKLLFIIITLHVAYQTFFVYMYGATLGKIFMKIKIVATYDLETPSLTNALIRAIMRNVSEIVLFLGFFWALTNPKRETWHDRTAQTLVVNVF